ncbi:uncharacterized protein LOC119434139 [Dermacentor silvarum]|uniref:uncharacterized protein LOC119434139 n=1 Tax=Dermacentor silvarum TaxID=543639 RepID=UPI00189B38E0|nr:uncharacterized protein LOC119434139 [Dermacentor silvarum]
MSAKTRLMIVAILAACFVWEVRAQNGGLPPAMRLPTTEGGGQSPRPTCAPSPKPGGWLANTTLLTQLAFWFGTVGLLVTLCATAIYFCCFSCEPVQVVRRQRRVHSVMSTEPLIPPATSGTNQRESRSTVRPVPVPAGNASGTAPASTTYATVFPRLAPFGSPQVRPPGVPATTQSSRGGALSAWSPVLEPHREEDEFGYQAQTLQPYTTGLPAYSTVASTAFPFNPPGPGPQHPAAMGYPRSPPPPYSLQGYQQ